MATSRIGGPAKRVIWPPHCWHMIDEVDLVRLVADHSAWLRLCARLEAMADELPLVPDEDELFLLRAQVQGLTQPSRVRDDRALDSLFARERARPLARSLLDGFHLARTARIVDVEDILTALEGEGAAVSADALGYMIRSFFRGCRSAIAMEQLALLALGSNRLTADARALLVERLTESSRPI
ncbi:hypothetical protein [Sphingomonas sp. MMS24-J13]|uniref:hypothetical protein n=1 Tax=Sphingomonas sp. MMS24-J13 TaxID=3238686 RepID=UPI00384BC8BD